MKKIIISIIVISLLVSASMVTVNAVHQGVQSTNTIMNTVVPINRNYTPHDPIYIYDDNDFTSENGVVSGSGSIDDPYMISGWEIEKIEIQGPPEKISKYFEVNNCKILGKIVIRLIKDNRCKIINSDFPLNLSVTNRIESGGYIDFITIKYCKLYIHEYAGIHLRPSENVTIKDCEFYSQHVYRSCGISAGPYTIIENCYFEDSNVGINTCDYNYVKNCYFVNSSDEGIVIRGNQNIIENCTFLNEKLGIEISTPQNNATIKNCSFIGGDYGIGFFTQYGNAGYISDYLIDNCEFKNVKVGIDIACSERITIRSCVFENCGAWPEGALYLRHLSTPQITRDCKIYDNCFLNNIHTINIESSDSEKVVDNLFYNNYFYGNTKNVERTQEGKLNRQQWNIEKTPGANIIGGPYLGGNFWDDYEGVDNDSDGIGDTPYWINENEAKDNLPLFNPPPETPTINGPKNGKTGVEYNYAFKSTDPYSDNVYYYVDWGDDSNSSWLGPYLSGQMVDMSHTWYEQGNYAIKAKAKDVYGAESDWGALSVTIPINQQSSQQQQSIPQQMFSLSGSPTNN
jgi:hypothetical protein